MSMKLGNMTERNGIRLWFGKTRLESKRPVLSVKVNGDDTWYNVAVFNSAEKADWFNEIFCEFMARERAEWVEGVCSECRREAVSGFKTRYCPHCGRRMVGCEG